MFRFIGKSIKKHQKRKEKKTYEKYIENVKGKIKECGENIEIFGNVKFSYPQKLVIKDRCKLNDNVYINARSGVEIGNDVTISYDAKIISTGYDIEKWIDTGEKVHIEDTPIKIGNHCWIGAGATILPGVKITGEYVIIGAGAVVTKNITESKVMVAGVPARIIKRLGEERNE